MDAQEEEQNPRAVIGGNNPPIEEVLKEAAAKLIAEIDPLAARANTLGPLVKEGIKDDATLGKVGEIITDARALSRRVEQKRKEEKEPWLEGGRKVDAFFNAHMARLDRIADAFQTIADTHQREKAAAERRKAEADAARLRDEEEKLRAAAESAKRPETSDRKHDLADEKAAQADAAEARAAQSNHQLAKVKTETGVTAGAKTEWSFKITDYEAIPLDKLRPYFKRDEIEKAIRAYVKIHKGAAELKGVIFEEEVKASFRR